MNARFPNTSTVKANKQPGYALFRSYTAEMFFMQGRWLKYCLRQENSYFERSTRENYIRHHSGHVSPWLNHSWTVFYWTLCRLQRMMASKPCYGKLTNCLSLTCFTYQELNCCDRVCTQSDCNRNTFRKKQSPFGKLAVGQLVEALLFFHVHNSTLVPTLNQIIPAHAVILFL